MKDPQGKARSSVRTHPPAESYDQFCARQERSRLWGWIAFCATFVLLGFVGVVYVAPAVARWVLQ